MKLGAVTKPNKRNKTTSEKFDDDVMPANCEVIVIFLISWSKTEAGLQTHSL